VKEELMVKTVCNWASSQEELHHILSKNDEMINEPPYQYR